MKRRMKTLFSGMEEGVLLSVTDPYMHDRK